MGIAALIIGIVAIVLGLVPACGLVFGLPPAIVGLILGIVEIKAKSKKQAPKGMGIAGTILNSIAIVVILIWTLVIAVGAKEAMPEIKGAVDKMKAEMEKAHAEMTEKIEEGATE